MTTLLVFNYPKRKKSGKLKMTDIEKECQNDTKCKFSFRRHGQGNPLEQLRYVVAGANERRLYSQAL